MKSIKPGRGPSAFGGVASVLGALFGVIWIVAAVTMGAPWFFALFGVAFVGLSIANAVFGFHNAFGKNRYSSFDITEDGEEPDPFHSRIEPEAPDAPEAPEAPEAPDAQRAFSQGPRYCPYCGGTADEGYAYCRYCGRKLPDE